MFFISFRNPVLVFLIISRFHFPIDANAIGSIAPSVNYHQFTLNVDNSNDIVTKNSASINDTSKGSNNQVNNDSYENAATDSNTNYITSAPPPPPPPPIEAPPMLPEGIVMRN